jgi:hypothetical protein
MSRGDLVLLVRDTNDCCGPDSAKFIGQVGQIMDIDLDYEAMVQFETEDGAEAHYYRVADLELVFTI